jgi:hypothetical protein
MKLNTHCHLVLKLKTKRGLPSLPTHIYGAQRNKFAVHFRSILHPYLSSNSDLAVSTVHQFKRWLSWPLVAYAIYVARCIVWTVSVYESVYLFPSAWPQMYSYSFEHNNAELSYSGLQNTANPTKTAATLVWVLSCLYNVGKCLI